MVDGRKYHSNAKSYFTEVRQISDQLCRKYGLSVIQTNQGKAMHYAQWKAEAEGKPTWRTAIRMDIRDAIGVSFSWSQFVKEMEKRGYTWKLNRKYPILKTTGDGAVYSSAFLGKRIWGGRNPGEDPASKDPTGVWKHADAVSEDGNLPDFRDLYYSYLYQMGVFPKKPKRIPYAVRSDIRRLDETNQPDGIFTKGRDHHQGRAGSIPETLGRTGTFFDERAQRIIPERTGRYAHSGNQWGVKRTS